LLEKANDAVTFGDKDRDLFSGNGKVSRSQSRVFPHDLSACIIWRCMILLEGPKLANVVGIPGQHCL